MGCCSSKLVEPSARTAAPRSGSTFAGRRGRPELSRSSLALAALPPTRHGSDSSSSSSSATASISAAGYDSGSDTELGGFTASLSSAVPTGFGDGDELGSDAGSAAGGLPHQRRPAASIKTTRGLRVGVLEGTTFLNQYIVIDTLGRGSFGKVKLCLNTGNDMLYAVKVVNTRLLRAADKSRLRMRLAPLAAGGAAASAPATPELPDLRREVEVMRALDHPNLLRLYEVIEDREGGKVLMVMEYAEGGAIVGLSTLSPERPLPEALAQFYFRQMAAGLAYLHEHHVVHGDVKPENVMLCGGGAVKIGDFGQSQFFDRRDTFNRTLGTPAYLAPEIAAGGAYHGRQADVWALGVSLYLFIFGELPFKGESVLDLYDAVAGGEVPYPAHRPLSAELQDLFLRLLHRDPRHRITAAEVLQHPWVRGSVWQSALLDGPGTAEQEGDKAAVEGHPLVPYSAEDVAAVVFPSISPHVAASPHSPGGGRTHLVDALAAAATARLEDGVAARLAHNPRSQLHQLSQDSMLRVMTAEQEWEQAGGEATTSFAAPSSDVQGSSSMPVHEGSRETSSLHGASSQQTATTAVQQQQGSEGPAQQAHAATDAAVSAGGRAAAEAGLSGTAEQARRLPAGGMSPQQAQRMLPPSPFGTPSPSPEPAAPQSGQAPLGCSAARQAAEQPLAASGPPAGRAQQQDAALPAAAGQDGAAAATSATWRSRLSRLSAGSLRASEGDAAELDGGPSPAPRRASLDGELPRRAKSAGALRAFFLGPADFVGGSSSFAVGSPPSDGAGSLQRASSADGPLAHPTAATAAGAAPTPRRRGPAPFVGLGDLVEAAMSGSQLPSSLPSRLPPRPPPPKPTAQHPMVVNIFRPGERLGMASATNQQHSCFYIEQGVVEVRYEADVPITLSSVLSAATNLFRRNTGAAAAATPPPAAAAPAAAPVAAGSADATSPAAEPASPHAAGAGVLAAAQQQQGKAPQGVPSTPGSPSAGAAAAAAAPSTPLSPEDKADSSVHGSHVFDLGVSAELQQQGSQLMQRSHSLAETVAQATLRAKALLASARAKGGSLDHLLVSERTTREFLGSLAMLDPHFLMGRWKASSVARTHVVALHMTREGLEAFLQQHPLAQVHLRASMARSRAEVVKLEALEKIAVARQHQAQVQERPSRPRSQRSTPSAGRLHLHRAGPGGLPLWRGTVAGVQPAAVAAMAAATAAAAVAAPSPAAQVVVPAGTAPVRAVAPAAAAAAAAAPGVAPAAEFSRPAELQAAAAAAEGVVEEVEVEESAEQLSEPGSPASTASTASSSSLEAAPPRRPPGISSDDAFSATLELFNVVSQLREAVSEQLRTTIEKRAGGAAFAASALGGGSALLPVLATAGSGSSG
ncbi:hypothetical protein ABPG75_003729 [Micractinium tetrahymenae]